MPHKNSLYYPMLTRRSQYSLGRKYTDYRAEISEDCQHRCVYCDAHENILGGYEAMQLDHFFPQKLFPDRKHDPLNLLWVCNRCNCLKRDDWHEIDISKLQTTKVGYIDPFAVDRTQFFLVEPTGTLAAVSGPAEYIIQRLKLNRSFLIYVRRSRAFIHEATEKVEAYFEQLIADHKVHLERQDIDLPEYERRVVSASAMKHLILDILNAFPSP